MLRLERECDAAQAWRRRARTAASSFLKAALGPPVGLAAWLAVRAPPCACAGECDDDVDVEGVGGTRGAAARAGEPAPAGERGEPETRRAERGLLYVCSSHQKAREEAKERKRDALHDGPRALSLPRPDALEDLAHEPRHPLGLVAALLTLLLPPPDDALDHADALLLTVLVEPPHVLGLGAAVEDVRERERGDVGAREEVLHEDEGRDVAGL